ncbi:hypothetical protein [uncultured Formosa sp.]|uniref:hypothetical protein n=1 Tax=uncultured Formosa sp. TaxID=255435 RepID=UPI0026387423|nr:hypothetical protein [uncultured Formosa sp.]
MLTKKDKLFYFESTYKLYEEYNKINTQNPIEGYQVGYTIDGLEILRQLDYLYKEITSFNNYFAEKNEVLTRQFEIWENHCVKNNIDYSVYMEEKRHEIPKLSNRKKSNEVSFKAKLFTEMFYYKAFRLRNIIRYSGGLGKKFECEGVRNVRNILIEHPEKSGFIYIYSFGLGIKEIGPILNTGNLENDKKFKDIGLFKNATEFKINLEKILTDFIN